MIISASRRTDIPAFYADWFINRVRAGYCSVPNAFNHNQVSRVSLLPEDVDVVVFWTRNPSPLFPYLDELKHRGYKFYFQYTILDNPRVIDPKSPPVDASIKTFKELSHRIGSDHVIWRYDPVVLGNQTDISFHKNAYEKIATALGGYTQRSVISIMDNYAKAKARLAKLPDQGYQLESELEIKLAVHELIPSLVQIADRVQMEIVSCAEEVDFSNLGVKPGKCIDDQYIQKVFGLVVEARKDPSQRKECGCVVSKDIGMYDSCLYGCQYCYATQNFERARRHYEAHDPQAPSLVGWYEPTLAIGVEKSPAKNNATQLDLFEKDE